MELRTIKKIHVISFALTLGVAYGVLGLFLGILMFLFIGLFSSMMPGFGHEAGLMAIGGGFIFIIIYPILLFAIGFISSAILAIVYNAIVPYTGGFKVEVE